MRLFHIEWGKILHNRSIWILLGLYLLLFMMISYIVGTIEMNLQGQALDLNSLPLMQFPDIWHNITYMGSYFNLILAFIIIMLVTNEFTFKTLRQHMIDGLTRVEFLAAKYLVILAFSLFVTFFVGILGAVVGFGHTEGAGIGKMLHGIEFLPAFFLQTFGYLALALLFGLFLRKAIFSIGLFVLYTWLIEKIPGWVYDYPFLEYLPSGTLNKLIQNPLYKYMGQPAQEHVEMLDVVVSLGYIGLFFGLSYLLLSKRDL